jgi:hypothetical protein
VARRLCGTDPAEIRDAFGALFRVRGELSEDRVLAEVSPAPGCLVNLAGCRTAHQAAGRARSSPAWCRPSSPAERATSWRRCGHSTTRQP